jgi:hydroxypyruvate isomerase
MDRRAFLVSATQVAAFAPLAFTASRVLAQPPAGAARAITIDQATPGVGLPPPYKLSINIELMFPNTMPRPERMRVVADHGVKNFSFFQPADEAEVDAMLKVQRELGMTCVWMNGNSNKFFRTGLTEKGLTDEWLADWTTTMKRAQRFAAKRANVFTGSLQPGVPWDIQRARVLEGVKRAADVARAYGVTAMLEPLSPSGGVPFGISTADTAFELAEALNEPNVKVCFDMYHLQQTQGNLVNSFKKGFDKNLIEVVHIGDVPGRTQPGTGEINYPNIFKYLRQVGYSGYIDTEHRTTVTPGETIEWYKRAIVEN